MNKIIIFDFDGTIADTNKCIIETFQQSLAEMSYPTLDDDSISQRTVTLFPHVADTLRLVIGTVRECFVVNQLSVNHTVEYSKDEGDFRIDGKVTLEVGGSKKSFDQIADIPYSYILADGMEYPVGKKLPIWLVGMNY